MIPYKQLSLKDVFEDCQNKFQNDKNSFLDLLQTHIDLDAFIPLSFRNHFYSNIGRKRKYPLQAFLWALILQRIFSIPTDSLLIIFLHFSAELREFCGFNKIPDASKFTRFKQDFTDELKDLFEHLVDLTEPICQAMDHEKASMTIFDTSGIEAFVTENNPKYLNTIIKQLETYKKAKKLDDSYDPHKAAYGKMPPHAASEPEVKQLYINGHFCYAYKFGVLTNGLGIVRSLSFFDKEYLKSHPEIQVDKKSDDPEEDKSLSDQKALIPVLEDFYAGHPLIKPDVFLGDSAFDSAEIYKALLIDMNFKKAYIPLNARADLSYPDCPLNEDGIPCCPKDPELAMKPEGSKSHLRSQLPSLKFVCPKMKWVKKDGKYKRTCFCEDPCTPSPSGRMFYIYPEKALRSFPGTCRGTDEWVETYKIRTTVERSINQLKDSYCLANRKTTNADTLKADLILAGITQLITVILADKIHQHSLIRSLKPLIA